MKNKKSIYIQSIFDKEARKKTEELREHLQDVVREITQDQQKWLDDMMRDLLPPNLYEAGKRGDMLREIGDYLKKHNIRLVYIADSLVIRIMVGDQIHSQFVPKLMLDGQELHTSISSQ